MNNQNIKFSNDSNPYFMQELRRKVKEYFDENAIPTSGGARIILKSVFMFTVYLAPYIIMLTGLIQSLPLMLLGWIIMGFGMAGVGLSVMHDANHRTFSNNPKINKLFAKSMYLLGGFPLIWQYQHNTLHHGYTNIEGHDEDISPGKILRFSPHKPKYKFHKYQHLYFWFFYSLSTLSWVTRKEFAQLRRYKKTNVKISSKKSDNRLFLELVISKIIYHGIFLIVPLVFLPFSWYWILAGFILMHFTCSISLSLIFGIAHIMPDASFPLPGENETIEENWAVHQLLTTTDFSQKNRLFTWLIGGLNYQVEHHLFPNICHVHYRKISILVKKTAEDYQLPYYVQDNFFGAIQNHIKMLKLLGR